MNVRYTDFERMHTPIKHELLQCYKDVYENQWFIQGKRLEQFEREYADFCGSKYCVGVGNGLDALRLILQAYDIGAGDEVIVPANTFIASVTAGNLPSWTGYDVTTTNVTGTVSTELATEEFKFNFFQAENGITERAI